jgi:hypothetical protein
VLQQVKIILMLTMTGMLDDICVEGLRTTLGSPRIIWPNMLLKLFRPWGPLGNGHCKLTRLLHYVCKNKQLLPQLRLQPCKQFFCHPSYRNT